MPQLSDTSRVPGAYTSGGIGISTGALPSLVSGSTARCAPRTSSTLKRPGQVRTAMRIGQPRA